MSSVMKVDSITKSDGTAGVHIAGHVIQVVSATKTDSQANATADSFTDITGLSLSITPKFNNSKIMLLCNISHSSTQNATGISFKVLRNSTALGGSEGSRTSVSFFGSPIASDNNMAGTDSWTYLDSPNTTSAITYKVQATGFNSGQTWYINTNISRNGQIYDDIAMSTLTAMEIAQ